MAEKTLVERMVEYRAKNGLSQTAFAEKVGVSTQTINTIENGVQTPSKITAVKIKMAMEE